MEHKNSELESRLIMIQTIQQEEEHFWFSNL